MAVLTPTELAALRSAYRETGAAVTTDKTILNAAFQAAEDYFENTARSGFGSAVAGAWGASTNGQKKSVVAVYLGQKMHREGF